MVSGCWPHDLFNSKKVLPFQFCEISQFLYDTFETISSKIGDRRVFFLCSHLANLFSQIHITVNGNGAFDTVAFNRFIYLSFLID